jgi:hypothetical protein
MKFGLLYEIEVARPWAETSVADCFWEALEQVKVAEEVGFTHGVTSAVIGDCGFGFAPMRLLLVDDTRAFSRPPR